MAPPPRSLEIPSPSPNRILVAIQPVDEFETLRPTDVTGMLRSLDIKFNFLQQLSVPADETRAAKYVNVFAIGIDPSAMAPSIAGPSGLKGPLPGQTKKEGTSIGADFATNAAAVGDRDDYIKTPENDPMQAHIFMMEKGQEQNDPVEFAAKRIEDYPGDERILKCQPDLKSRLFPVTVTDRVNRNGFLGIPGYEKFQSDERLIISYEEIALAPTTPSHNPGGYAMSLDDMDLNL